MRTAALLVCSLLGLGACGDNLGPDSAIDAGIDAPTCVQRPQGQVGGPCTMDAQCESAPGAGDGLCLTAALGGIGWPAGGFCVNKVDLVSQDCSNGCHTDAECGDGNVCVSVEGCNACVPACCTGDACPSGQVCTDSLIGADLGKSACLPGNDTAVDGATCAGFSDCAVGSICFSDPFEHPGGTCATVGCTVGDDSTCAAGGDGHCINLPTITTGTGCVDRCANDADCRMADGYRCFDGGADGKYCRHPETGDACAVDADCGQAGVWQCRTGAAYPGGYCTPIPQCNPTNGAGCTPGSSVCFDPTGPDDPYCVDRCVGTGQGTCRPGYTCTQVGNARGCVP
ncbi:MAG TPA: hypothetical protein VHE35_27795 [Kofleriaceae bacterium]|nr:hypothetical protein [Kofleriaceae bacterium]